MDRRSEALIRQASSSDLSEVRTMFREYEASIQIDLCFQGFEEELLGLPGKYAPPDGSLLLAAVDGRTAGCVALRRLADDVCEMKRLYVRAPYRFRGVGLELVNAILEDARRRRYLRIRLDTIPVMGRAIALYQRVGFKEIPAYYANPHPGVLFLERDLEQPLPPAGMPKIE